MKLQKTKIEGVAAGADSDAQSCDAAQTLAAELSGDICEKISPETLASIQSIVSFVRKEKVRVRSVKLLPNPSGRPGWNTRGQGRIQTPHNLRDA
jgi:hypothetical protein